MIEKLKELAGFVRLRVCLGIALLALAGSLRAAPPSPATLLPVLPILLTFCAGYALNNITDVGEDLVNRKKVCALALNRRAGIAIVSALQLSALAISFFISAQFFAFAILLALVSLAYSLLRLKRFPLIKNIYTGVVVGSAYLGGALAFLPSAVPLIAEYLLASSYVALLSFVSDIRDIEGDRQLRISTIAALLGENPSVLLGAALFLALSLAIISSFPAFALFIPFLIFGFFLLMLKKYELSHFTGTLAFLAYIGARLAGG